MSISSDFLSNEICNCFSWIDHFITLRTLFAKVINAKVVELGSNLSDHCPIWIHIGDVDGLAKTTGTVLRVRLLQFPDEDGIKMMWYHIMSSPGHSLMISVLVWILTVTMTKC